MTTDSKIENIKQLVKRLNGYRNAYYNDQSPMVSDREYDELFDRLAKLEEETGFVCSDSPTVTVGYEVKSELEKVKHSHPMLSLEKTKKIEDLVSFSKDKNCLLSLKMDGLTVCLTYKNGFLSLAETRGDGSVGDSITHNAKVFKNVPLHIPYEGDLEIEGEAIITYDDFKVINERQDAEKAYKNPRNLVSGSVRQLDSSIAAGRNIQFIAWKIPGEIIDPTSGKLNRFSNRLEFARYLGFDVVPYVSIDGSEGEDGFEDHIQHLRNEAIDKGYPIDGMVITYDDIQYGLSLGTTSHHPKHSMAYKFYDEGEETTLRYIEWNTTRSGMINPVAVFDPVEIDGTTVSRATLNNVSIVEEMEFGIGDTITVTKANQIIPKIVDNLTRSGTYEIPGWCPECKARAEIHADAGRKTLHCTNADCPSILVDRLENFASKNAMDIKGLSATRIRALIELGYVRKMTDLFYLKEHIKELSDAVGFGFKMSMNIIQSIEQSRHCELWRVLSGLGIVGVGKASAKIIGEYCHSMSDDAFMWFIEKGHEGFDWSELPDIGASTRDNINQYVRDNLPQVKMLHGIIDVIKPPVPQTATREKYSGRIFCISGALSSFKNKDSLISDIEKRGGQYLTTVSKKVQYLITNDASAKSSKVKRAIDLGIRIISEEEYIENKF